MATSKEYKEFVLEQLSILDNINCKPMMGEYLLYYNNVLFGGIYDDRLLVKIVTSNEKYKMEKAIPYHNGKEMYLVDSLDDRDELYNIVLDTYEGLQNKN